MAQLMYDSSSFKGIDTYRTASSGGILACDNYDAMRDDDSNATVHFGFMTKKNGTTAFGDTITGYSTRGVNLFIPTDYGTSGDAQYVQAFGDGTLRYLLSNVWTTIKSGFTTSAPFTFAAYNLVLFASNGLQAIQKWRPEWTSAQAIKDKNVSAVIPGSYTITFVQNAVTMSTSADLTAVILEGDWIKTGNSETAFYEVRSVTSGTITLYLPYLGSGGTTTAAYKASNAVARGKFILTWKDRLFYASGDLNTEPIVGLFIVGNTDTPLL